MAYSSDLTLRVLGTSVTLIEPLRQAAMADLGFNIDYQVLSGVGAQQTAVLNPDSFDLYDQWFHSVELLWTTGAIQPIETGRISAWPRLSDLSTRGYLNPSDRQPQGIKPVDQLYVQVDGALGAAATDRISMLPTVHNVDSFGYDPSSRDIAQTGVGESWAWLFDPVWHGKCGLLSDPAIGVLDVALAASAAGLIRFDNLGNLTIEEIDALIALLVERKKSGHFKHFWATSAESEARMAQRRTLIATLWSPAVFTVKSSGTSIRNAAPIEGYRAWHGGMCLSSHVDTEHRDAAYAYMNWWLSGQAGAAMARQGYYMSELEGTRSCLSDVEWDYLYEGEPAAQDLTDMAGRTYARAGTTRDGGSYRRRLSNIAVWNTLMDEHNYLVRRWSEFLNS